MRGLVVAVLFGLVGIAGLSELLGLEEIKKLIEDFTPSIAVILAILFQPELRRMISQLGEQNRLGRLLGKRPDETLSEIVQAVAAMASRRVGALIAIERDFALDEYTQKAVHLDSAVNRLALESIFHPGASLHDGAVVIRGDRIVAAACLFPLSENEGLSKSTGTRHRAALGLTEETDAVTIVVSEETGQASVGKRGQIERDVPLDRLEKTLREKLGLSDGEKPSAVRGLRAFLGLRALREAFVWTFTADIPRKLSALVVSTALIFLAHREIAVTRTVPVRIVPIRAAQAASFDRDGEIGVILPGGNEAGGKDVHLASPSPQQPLSLQFTGSRKSMDKLRGHLSGVLDASDLPLDTALELPLEDVRGTWNDLLGITAGWEGGRTPILKIGKFVRRRIELTAANLVIDDTDKPTNYVAQKAHANFTPDAIEIVGSAEAIALLDSGELAFQFAPVVLSAKDRNDKEERLELSQELRASGIALATDKNERVSVLLPIVPVVKEIGTIEKEIVVVDLSPEAGDRSALWQLPPLRQRARFRIETRGLLPADADPNSPTWIERTSEIRRYVQDNLRVFVDVSAMEEAAGTRAPIQWGWAREWKEELSFLATEDERADLKVRLDGQKEDEDVLLVASEATRLEDSGGDGGPTSTERE